MPTKDPSIEVRIGVHISPQLLALLDEQFPLLYLPPLDVPERKLWHDIGQRKLVAFLKRCHEAAVEHSSLPTNKLL
jgi:hypothetical protein